MQGLANTGNTCYINTFVQCIGHVSCLRNWILNRQQSGEFTKELKEILHRMWEQKQSLLPRRFVYCVQSAFGFEPDEQHDINELTMLCFDKIAVEDTSEVMDIASIAQTSAKNSNIHAVEKMAISAWTKYHPKGFREWSLLTEGLQVQQVQCMTCKACLHNFEPFTVINIDLNDTENDVCLTQKLTEYFETEQLTEWKCDKCGSVQPSEKVVRMWKLPHAFGIVLNRFRYCAKTGSYVKMRNSVKVPHHISFSKKHVLSGETYNYRLCSIAMHHGSMHMGHYTCLGRVQDNWYHYDDINVNKINIPDSLDSKEAYLLMYERS